MPLVDHNNDGGADGSRGFIGDSGRQRGCLRRHISLLKFSGLRAVPFRPRAVYIGINAVIYSFSFKDGAVQ